MFFYRICLIRCQTLLHQKIYPATQRQQLLFAKNYFRKSDPTAMNNEQKNWNYSNFDEFNDWISIEVTNYRWHRVIWVPIRLHHRIAASAGHDLYEDIRRFFTYFGYNGSVRFLHIMVEAICFLHAWNGIWTIVWLRVSHGVVITHSAHFSVVPVQYFTSIAQAVRSATFFITKQWRSWTFVRNCCPIYVHVYLRRWDGSHLVLGVIGVHQFRNNAPMFLGQLTQKYVRRHMESVQDVRCDTQEK